jgi:type IV pilus assembly protein PilW
MTNPRRRREGGFTLINLLVSMGISGIALSAVTTTFVSQSQSYDAQEQIVEMQQNARAAMDIMTREIRMAGYSPTGASLVGVHYHSDKIHIRADITGDGDINDPNEDIKYSYDSANLRIERDAEAGIQPFADNIQAFTMAYFDNNGNATTNSAVIRQIQITITARTAEIDRNYPFNGGYQTYSLTSLVTPRNLAY